MTTRSFPDTGHARLPRTAQGHSQDGEDADELAATYPIDEILDVCLPSSSTYPRATRGKRVTNRILPAAAQCSSLTPRHPLRLLVPPVSLCPQTASLHTPSLAGA